MYGDERVAIANAYGISLKLSWLPARIVRLLRLSGFRRICLGMQRQKVRYVILIGRFAPLHIVWAGKI